MLPRPRHSGVAWPSTAHRYSRHERTMPAQANAACIAPAMRLVMRSPLPLAVREWPRKQARGGGPQTAGPSASPKVCRGSEHLPRWAALRLPPRRWHRHPVAASRPSRARLLGMAASPAWRPPASKTCPCGTRRGATRRLAAGRGALELPAQPRPHLPERISATGPLRVAQRRGAARSSPREALRRVRKRRRRSTRVA